MRKPHDGIGRAPVSPAGGIRRHPRGTTERTLAMGLAVAALAGIVGAPPARADVCSGEIIVARGEASRIAWVARQKARSAWRHRVRLLPGLGDPYANWLRAMEAEESCITGPAGTQCTLTGRPCKR